MEEVKEHSHAQPGKGLDKGREHNYWGDRAMEEVEQVNDESPDCENRH